MLVHVHDVVTLPRLYTHVKASLNWVGLLLGRRRPGVHTRIACPTPAASYELRNRSLKSELIFMDALRGGRGDDKIPRRLEDPRGTEGLPKRDIEFAPWRPTPRQPRHDHTVSHSFHYPPICGPTGPQPEVGCSTSGSRASRTACRNRIRRRSKPGSARHKSGSVRRFRQRRPTPFPGLEGDATSSLTAHAAGQFSGARAEGGDLHNPHARIPADSLGIRGPTPLSTRVPPTLTTSS
jgi:hypothetical protein